MPMLEHGGSRPTTIDLFCGAGGITQGFSQAGFRCLYGNDVNPEAIRTFTANHPDAIGDVSDVGTVDPKGIRRRLKLRRGELDVLVGGPPCQGFSIYAPERFLDDERNVLFKHFVRFLEEFRPKTFLLENVPGMLSLGGGAIFEQIQTEFRRRGYEVNVRILFAAHYGVPQERWRLVMLGSRDGGLVQHPEPTHYATGRANFRGGRTMTFAASELDRSRLNKFVTVREAISDLPRLVVGQGEEEQPYTLVAKSDYAKLMREGSEAVYNHVAARLSKQNMDRMKHVKPGGSWRDIPFELLPKGMKRARRSDHTRRYGRLDPNRLSGTVLTKCDPHWGTVILPDQDRTLTVREAARLQSFPDRYRFLGSRVAQYEQVGNAVPVLMAQRIAEAIAAYLGLELAMVEAA